MKKKSQLNKAYSSVIRIVIFSVLLCLLSKTGLGQAILSDTCTYEKIKLDKFYNQSCKELFKEIQSKNKKILFCGYKKRKKSMTIGIVVQIADSSEIQVYFRSAIHEPLKGPACENKAIDKSEIDYFVISYFNGSKRIVSRGIKRNNYD